MTDDDTDLMSYFEGRFDDIVLLGPVPDGVRMDGHFSGPITGGALAGGHLTGVDYYRMRPDGVGIIDARELITVDGSLVSVRVQGYVVPPPDTRQPSIDELLSPDFSWPDVPHEVRASALFETGAAGLGHLNATVVAHTGWVNYGTGELVIEARRVGRTPVGASPAAAV